MSSQRDDPTSPRELGLSVSTLQKHRSVGSRPTENFRLRSNLQSIHLFPNLSLDSPFLTNEGKTFPPSTPDLSKNHRLDLDLILGLGTREEVGQKSPHG